MVFLLQLERATGKRSAAQFVHFPLHFNYSTSVRKSIQIISSSNDSFVSVFEMKVIYSWAWSNVHISLYQVILISNVWNMQQSSLKKTSFRLLLPLSEQDHLQQVSSLVFLHYCCAHVQSIFCLLFTNFFHRLYNMMFIYCIHTKNRCCVNCLLWTVWYLLWRLHHPSSMLLRDRVLFAYFLWWFFPFKFTVVFPLLNCFII